MELLQFETTEQLRREAVAARLHELADQLARHNGIEVEREGRRYKIDVPNEVELSLEIELRDDGGEIEVELSWSTS